MGSLNTPSQPFIDVARGIAILMVILVHTAQSVPGLPGFVVVATQYGQHGVQLFFVASAYTLCKSFEARCREPHPIRSFYIRRYFRIAPLYYTGICIYFIVNVARNIAIDGTPRTEPYSLSAIGANVLFIHGFVPWANNNIVPGGWSIGTEMAFYLAFPVLIHAASGHYKRTGKPPLQLFAASILLNIGIQLCLDRFTSFSWGSNFFIYFNFINQLAVFCVGFVVFYLHAGRHTPGRGRIAFTQSLVGFAAFTAGALFVSTIKWGEIWFIGTPLFSGISFGFLLNLLRITNASNRPLVAIGRVSYSMYVVHFLFAWNLLGSVVGGVTLSGPEAVMVLLAAYVGVVYATFRAARVTERWIESPGIQLGKHVVSMLGSAQSSFRSR